MRIRLKKTIGYAVVNLIRQVVMTDIPEYRPVAFRVGENSNVLHISDSVEEDMTEFISKFWSGDFVSLSNEEIIRETFTCNKVFSLSDVKTSNIVFSGEDKEILHSLSPVDIEVIFRYGTGNYSSEENEAYLTNKGIDTSKFVCISSRHCLVKNFSFTEIEDGDFIIFDIRLQCKPGVQENTLISIVVDRFKELLDLMK